MKRFVNGVRLSDEELGARWVRLALKLEAAGYDPEEIPVSKWWAMCRSITAEAKARDATGKIEKKDQAGMGGVSEAAAGMDDPREFSGKPNNPARNGASMARGMDAIPGYSRLGEDRARIIAGLPPVLSR
jgi:hypothetical protein